MAASSGVRDMQVMQVSGMRGGQQQERAGSQRIAEAACCRSGASEPAGPACRQQPAGPSNQQSQSAQPGENSDTYGSCYRSGCCCSTNQVQSAPDPRRRWVCAWHTGPRRPPTRGGAHHRADGVRLCPGRHHTHHQVQRHANIASSINARVDAAGATLCPCPPRHSPSIWALALASILRRNI
eukprot:COSAG01_NODE_1804_length_9192_cov_31.006049_8_plen_182_part_00